MNVEWSIVCDIDIGKTSEFPTDGRGTFYSAHC